MRTYALDSPQAAARILALALLADGHLDKRELDALERVDAHGALGLRPTELHEVIHALCEDLLSSASSNWGSACRIEPALLGALLAEIRDPRLLDLCVAAIAADDHVSEGEALVLREAAVRWT